MFYVGAFAAEFAFASATAAFGDEAVTPDAPAFPAIHVSPGDSRTYELHDDVTADLKRTLGFRVKKATDAEIETRETFVRRGTRGNCRIPPCKPFANTSRRTRLERSRRLAAIVFARVGMTGDSGNSGRLRLPLSEGRRGMSIMGRFAFAAAFVFAGAYSAVADDAAQPKDATPPANTKIEVARGDRWTYEVRDDVTDELKNIVDFAVTDITESEIDTRVRYTNAVTSAESTAVQVFDPKWRLKDNGSNIFRPGVEETGIPSDIKVGKTWSYSYDSSRINPPSHFKFVGNGKVESWEHVAVANGLAYDAFKIVYTAAVTPVVNNRKFELKIELWYAPAANRYVKRRYESRQNGKLLDASLETLRNYSRRDN